MPYEFDLTKLAKAAENRADYADAQSNLAVAESIRALVDELALMRAAMTGKMTELVQATKDKAI